MRPQQSDAYSPHESPRPANQGDQVNAIQDRSPHATNHPGGQMNGGTQSQHGKVPDSGTNSSRVTSHTNGHHPTVNGEAVNVSPQNPTASEQSVSSLVNSSLHPQLFLEARKKAQNAVMNLYPHSIRFQTYVDEGMGETAASLFDDLGLSRENASSGEDASENGISQPTALSTLANGKEPSKDGSTSHTAMSTAPAAKPTGMTDKEKTLQSKMDALRKSREERAQKAAAKNSMKSPTNPISSTPAQTAHAAPSGAPVSTTTSSNAVENPPVPALQPQTSGLSASVQSPKSVQQQGPMIPGLFLASTAASPAPSLNTQSPVLTQTNQRKRPVAADFDIPASTPFKRPFGQSRNEQPLVIDVSDEEPDSDDEDVAMDLESQADQD